jgi:RimJ/RimL family protein N-acetyltransferase
LSVSGPWDPPTILTERLVIRPMRISDLPSVHRYACSYPVDQYGSWLGGTDPDDVARYIADTVARYGRPPRCDLGITLRNPPADRPPPGLIGGIGYRQVWLSPPTLELGCVVHPDHVGTGYAQETFEAVIDHLWRQWPALVRCESRIHAGAMGARAVLERLGFELEGVLRSGGTQHGQLTDGMLYGLVRPGLQSNGVVEQ